MQEVQVIRRVLADQEINESKVALVEYRDRLKVSLICVVLAPLSRAKFRRIP